jgi:hypothetical protein
MSYTADVVDTEKWDIIYLHQTQPQQVMRQNKKLVWWQQTLHQKVFIIYLLRAVYAYKTSLALHFLFKCL